MSRLETYFELPHSVGFDVDALGRGYSARVDGVACTLQLPRPDRRDDFFLASPNFDHVSDQDFEIGDLIELSWGVWAVRDPNDGSVGGAWVKTIGLAISCVPGCERDTAVRILGAIKAWWPTLCDWIEVLTRQVHTDPEVVVLGDQHRVWAEMDGNWERLSLPVPATIGAERDGYIDSPVVLSAAGLQTALWHAAKGPPPIEWLLIRDGRLAHAHGARRRAVIDAGTAAELAVTELVRSRLGNVSETVLEQLLAGHRMLGARTKLLEALGGPVPPDTKARLIEPRNRATHRGREPGLEESSEALRIAAHLVNTAYPLAGFERQFSDGADPE